MPTRQSFMFLFMTQFEILTKEINILSICTDYTVFLDDDPKTESIESVKYQLDFIQTYAKLFLIKTKNVVISHYIEELHNDLKKIDDRSDESPFNMLEENIDNMGDTIQDTYKIALKIRKSINNKPEYCEKVKNSKELQIIMQKVDGIISEYDKGIKRKNIFDIIKNKDRIKKLAKDKGKNLYSDLQDQLNPFKLREFVGICKKLESMPDDIKSINSDAVELSKEIESNPDYNKIINNSEFITEIYELFSEIKEIYGLRNQGLHLRHNSLQKDLNDKIEHYIQFLSKGKIPLSSIKCNNRILSKMRSNAVSYLFDERLINTFFMFLVYENLSEECKIKISDKGNYNIFWEKFAASLKLFNHIREYNKIKQIDKYHYNENISRDALKELIEEFSSIKNGTTQSEILQRVIKKYGFKERVFRYWVERNSPFFSKYRGEKGLKILTRKDINFDDIDNWFNALSLLDKRFLLL